MMAPSGANAAVASKGSDAKQHGGCSREVATHVNEARWDLSGDGPVRWRDWEKAVPLQRKRVSGGTLEGETATKAFRAQMRASIIHDFQVLMKTEGKKVAGVGGCVERDIVTHTKTPTASVEQLGRRNFPLTVVITESRRSAAGAGASPFTVEQSTRI